MALIVGTDREMRRVFGETLAWSAVFPQSQSRLREVELRRSLSLGKNHRHNIFTGLPVCALSAASMAHFRAFGWCGRDLGQRQSAWVVD
jgi:hypothetical protein